MVHLISIWIYKKVVCVWTCGSREDTLTPTPTTHPYTHPHPHPHSLWNPVLLKVVSSAGRFRDGIGNSRSFSEIRNKLVGEGKDENVNKIGDEVGSRNEGESENVVPLRMLVGLWVWKRVWKNVRYKNHIHSRSMCDKIPESVYYVHYRSVRSIRTGNQFSEK